jgi:hypothetical protein
MKKLIIYVFITLGCTALTFGQQTNNIKQTTPVTTIKSAEKSEVVTQDKSSENSSSTTHACCKGKSAKDCCKGKKGDAKSCTHHSSDSNKTHKCAGHANTSSASGNPDAKPACCAGKKDGTGCSHHKQD